MEIDQLTLPADTGIEDEGAPVNKIHVAGVMLIGFVVVAVIATLSVFAYSAYQGYQFDYANHKAMVQIIQYNLQQGRLLPIPQAVTAPPAPAGAPPPPAAPEPKK